MAESLWALAHGKAVEIHYPELFAEHPPEESRTPEEVTAHMLSLLRGGEG